MGDCLALMADLPDASIDAVIGDLPYGTTANKWDSIIPLDEMWAQFRRVCKPGAPIVLFSQQPFTTTLAASNIEQLKSEWIWRKPQGTGFLNAKRYPLKSHENILVFCDRLPPYNPQKSQGHKPYVVGKNKGSTNYRELDPERGGTVCVDGSRYPTTVLEFGVTKSERGAHPTQKPVALLEYLIRTYSNEGDLVLDPTMGSGSTGVAALNAGRRFVGIERDAGYFAVAEERIATVSPPQFRIDNPCVDAPVSVPMSPSA